MMAMLIDLTNYHYPLVTAPLPPHSSFFVQLPFSQKWIFSGRTTKWWVGVKPKTLLTTKQKTTFFYNLKKNYQNLMKHKKN